MSSHQDAKSSTIFHNKEVVILGAARTPIGSFRSQLATVPAPQLGSIAIKAALERSRVRPEDVQEIVMGQVCQANVGQSPARQAALGAGLSFSTVVTTVNKVCSSGLKAVIIAAQQIQTGNQDIVIGGGMENMSQIPFYVARGNLPYGGFQVEDGIIKDGFTDAYDKCHMVMCGEKTSKDTAITREQQDEYAISSYKKAADAWKNGIMEPEIVPVHVKTDKGENVVETDEEFTKIDFDKMKHLKPVFQEGQVITAGNASPLNDGAAAVVLSSFEAAEQLGIKPMARILSYADAATHPLDFPIAPTLLVPKLLKNAGIELQDIDHFEINEPFSCVPLAFIKTIGVDPAKVNPHGGAVSLGHPIGMSGARLIAHLTHTLQPGQKGLAATCNGGGGASGMIIQRL